MKITVKIFVIFAVILSSVSSWAGRRRISYQKGSCETHLTYTQSQIEFDFKASELEALYLDIVRMTAQLEDGSLRKGETEKYMKMKAEFFNDAMPVIRSLRAFKRDGVEASIQLRNVLEMIQSLGGEFRPFISYAKARKTRGIKDDSGRAVTIGFVLQDKTENVVEGDRVRMGFALPAGMIDDEPVVRGPIGFTPLKLREATGPTRDPGHLTFAFDFDTQTAIIHDGFTDQTYKVKGTLLNSLVGLNEETTFAVEFDNDEEEWILSYKRRVNVEGKIGF